MKDFYQETFLKNFRVSITYEGLTEWSFAGLFETSCALDLTLFPFDKQVCSIVLENWVYTGAFVDMTNTSGEILTDHFQPNGEWDLTKTNVEKETLYYTGLTYPSLSYKLYLSRKPGYYIINIMTPCFLMVVLSLVMFWLPPEAGEKVSLGITVLLAFSVFQLVIAENSPANSDFHPVISKFIHLETIIRAMLTIQDIIYKQTIFCF